MSNLLAASEATTKDLDLFSWQAICNWPMHSEINVIHEGLDYGTLTRSFLWDKVPRAIRARSTPKAFAFEQDLLNQSRQNQVTSATYPQWKRQLKWPLQLAQRAINDAQFRLSRAAYSKPVLFVPRQHSHLCKTLTALVDQSIQLVAPLEHGINPGVRRFQTLVIRRPDAAFAKQLFHGILRGLKAFDIELLLADRQQLQQQIFQQMSLVRQAEAELMAAIPQAMLVFADTHTALQEYVAIANRMNIPTILLQHGLDCEQYCLNEVQSTVVAVWGAARQHRYQAESQQQPARIEVVGNPEYDQQRLPDRLGASGDRWLWTTRPHGSHKCLSPSRSPHEGLDILEALLIALKQHETARLTIKPHPLDYIDLYIEQINKRGLNDRVTINRDPLLSVLPESDIVISEDSTAAMEAMFFGKILVHAHFTASPPVLPLIDYGAALPGLSPTMLEKSLIVARSLTPQARETMLKGQQRFVYDYAGPLDGHACQRVTALITQVMASTVDLHPA